MNRIIIIVLCLFGIMPVYPQSEQNYSAVNPALFAYKEEDVYVRPLTKFNNGRNIIKPNPAAFPWEARLENAMPNVIKDENGNISIYISSFIVYSPSPPSKIMCRHGQDLMRASIGIIRSVRLLMKRYQMNICLVIRPQTL